MLSLTDVTFRIAGRVLLNKASLSVPSGHRVGLVGPNGTGKSTLFKLITGELEQDNGDIDIISGVKVGMVRQDLPEDDTTLIDIVLAADSERAALMLESETAEDPQRIADIYQRLNDIDAFDAPARASTILMGLGFDQEAQNSPISSFSGGWRMRVALAAALFQNADLLLLDEPTNHLDFEAIVWLENYLQTFKNTFILISHDRDILNKTVTHIAHLDQLKLTMYTGTYDEFETRRAQKMMSHQALFEKQQAQKNRMMDFVKRFGAKASKAKQAQSRMKAIEKMDMVDALIADRAVAFQFPQPEEISAPIIALEGVDIGYAVGKPVLKGLNLRIDMDDRIALLGANGNGKSTLIKLLSDTLQPLTGDIKRHGKLRIGHFAQHQSEELDMQASPYEVTKRLLLKFNEPQVRALLGRFGFDKGKADTKIEELSGGEKARLLFCLMSYDAPHIMLLDEPTNHLDMDARAALIGAINDYQGCVILVSHDPHLVEAVADQLWLVKDGTVKPYNDDLEAYKLQVIEQRRRERADAKKQARNAAKMPERSSEKGAKISVAKAEETLEKFTKIKADLEHQMTTPKALSDSALMRDLSAQYDKALADLASAEDHLMTALEQFED